MSTPAGKQQKAKAKPAAQDQTAAAKAQPAKNQRSLTGTVVSDKMDKTVTVLVERQVMHPVIGKVVSRTKKYHAHNEGNDAKMGDRVVIQECRPISKTKAWKVAKVQERARPE
jgi:small subunit ribosomal protein S17